jgi:predicted ABC-type ATPase
MPTLYIIAGPNGAGKTTFARRKLAAKPTSVEFVNADSIAQGLSPYAPETAAIAAGRLMITRLRELSARQESFAFETTLSGRAYRPLLAEMGSAGYTIELDFLWLPFPEQSIDRVAERVTQGGHHIPEDVIRRRHVKGLKNLFNFYRPLLGRWTLYDNTRSPSHLIARGVSGNLFVSDLEAFAKIQDIVEDKSS